MSLVVSFWTFFKFFSCQGDLQKPKAPKILLMQGYFSKYFSEVKLAGQLF